VQLARIYHNPRCSTSRGALAVLDGAGVDYEVVRYLDDPPDADSLRQIIAMLDAPARDLVRRDAHFRELGIDPAVLEDEETIVALLVEHPRLLQRPVVVLEGRAIIARPSEILHEALAAD
jgi:arsenate reductase